jgi:hemerythrin superfamily protein
MGGQARRDVPDKVVAFNIFHDARTTMFGMTSPEGTNAIDLLKRDHDEVDKMFAQYEDLKEGGSGGDKEMLVAEICDALTVHAQI